MKNLNNRIAFLLLMVAGMFGVQNAVADTAIPLSVGDYLVTSTSETTGTINNNDGGNLGGIYGGATATFNNLTVAEAQDLVLAFKTGYGSNSDPEVTVTLNNGTSDVYTNTVDIVNIGKSDVWTPNTLIALDLGEVAAGTYSLTFSFAVTSGYVGNLGSIGIYSKDTFYDQYDDVPGDITLTNGIYTTARVEGGGNVGYCSNGANAIYSFNNSAEGKATLNIGLVHYGDGTLNVRVVDATTGEVELTKALTINSGVCNGYDKPTAFELGNITAGMKDIEFSISTSASYLCNYKNVSIDVKSWKNIDIDLRDGQLGTSGSGLSKYLTIDDEDNYSYADEEPAEYNALLSASSYNGNQHGYMNFKAKVPVEAGIYKITLGTCQYGTGTGYVKNADESSTLNIIDENGQTVTSFNQNTGACYHNNTTDNVVSVWYEAESDETITIVCGNYTPYFSIESVNSVPELKYTVTYANNTADVEGTVPSVAYATAGNSVTLPVNRTLYKDGYTLTGWSDGNTTYEPGDSYTPTANVTLNAVFTQNTYTFDQTVSEMTVRWDFQRQSGCPTITKQGASAILVQQADVNGNTIDMKMYIDATSGKFDNGSWNDWAQVNEGATFSFPSVEGTTVKAYSMNEPKNNSDVKSSVDGNEYSSYASYVATYATTPTSNSSTLTVKGVMGDTYYRYIDVTYPAAAITGITELTVDGVAVSSEIIAAINNGDAYTATLSGNTYTTVPAVQATFDTSAQATGEVSGTGTSRTYTITQNDKTYTLIVEGIHVYSKGEGEETVNLKYTSEQVSDNVWSNGVYSLSPVGDGWNNSGFKLNKNNNPFTLTVPSDVQVKQFIIHDFKDNYTEGAFNTITSEGMTTAYIPTKHNLPNTDGEKYNLVINLDDHQAGEPIVFSFTGGSQITGWYELTVAHSNPGTAPVKTAESVTVVNNHAVVAVTFDREIPGDVEATINETTVTAEGGASTLYFPVWDLSYSTNYTLTIAAGAVEDAYGNTNESAIEIAVNVPAKPSVAAAAYDYVVSNASELTAALDAVEATNGSANAARKTIFLKNGDYDLGTAATDNSVRWVRAHNLSLIGESRDGVVIHGTSDGFSNPVLNLRYWQGYYLQDLTVLNDKNYGLENKNGVAVAIYGGDKTIMKNVRMLSNQDTQVTGHRAYMEDCKIHGTVDFICGGGDNFYYHTDLVLEDRGGNVIVAPNTSSSTKWGYVFQECTVKALDAAAATTNAGSYYLGRPWQNEPRAYYLNTTMEVLPATAGWTSMSELPTHFYEYNSMNGSGVALDLSGRTNSPTSTNTYDPVLTSGEAAKFTLQNVLGGTDSWLPTDYTTVMDAPVVTASGNSISWDAVDDARCYVIFKDGEYLTNQTETSYDITAAGVYTVRAANEMGGLGETSDEVAFISKTISAAGWATLCSPYALDFSGTGLTAYIVTGTVGETTELDVESVDDVPATTGVLLEGDAGVYYIPVIASSATDVDGNKLVGVLENTVKDANSIYVLMNETAGVGFYKNNKQFTVGANTAYLPADFAGGETTARSAYFFRGEITGIGQIENGELTIENSMPAKRIVNGKLVIEKNGKKFSAAGQQVK